MGIGSSRLNAYSSPYQLFANSGNSDFVAARVGTVADKVVVDRSISVSGDTPRNVDFANEGFAPEVHAITLNNLDATWSVVESSSSIITNLGTRIGLGGTATQWAGFPAAQTMTNDVYFVEVTAARAGTFRRASRYVTSPANFRLQSRPYLAYSAGLADGYSVGMKVAR